MMYGQGYYLPEDYLKSHIERAYREFRDYEYLGAHFTAYEGQRGISFMVLAPKAERVELVGKFNAWDGRGHLLKRISDTGIWHIFICGLEEHQQYKYKIFGQDQRAVYKSDPYAFYSQLRPDTASVCVSLEHYQWQDHDWLKRQVQDERMNVYELHLGSWRKKENGDFYTYREICSQLLEYVIAMGYTHIELLPLAEHPFDGSWGYQVTGYFSITSRYGAPDDFMYLVDQCHQRGIGVILDWVPVHFCRDEHGLSRFDSASLYEYEDPVMSDNVQWGTVYFYHGKQEVVRFLISNALFWLDKYHIDGLRVDAVSYMLYLDAGRTAGKWLPNEKGGRENLNAVSFLKKLNEVVHESYPNTLMIAEEATAWPMVTGSIEAGGLGFDLKWNMGWMNDVLRYMEMDPIYRKWHHHLICFSFVYAFTEKYILVLSHDEVVHGKKSLLSKMPGDYWSKFANLRAFYGYMMGHPGKKLLFMGGEFGQFIEWNEQRELDWLLLGYDSHRQLQNYVRALNRFCQSERALYQLDHSASGFEWVDASNCDESIVVFIRKAAEPANYLVVLCNFTPVARQSYRIGVPESGLYREVFNSDAKEYGGKGLCNEGDIPAIKQECNNRPYCINITVPPLCAIFLKPKRLG